MEFTPTEKRAFLAAFTKLLKKVYGRGPNNIYIRYFPHKVHIVVQGIVSNFEKHLIANFDQEAIDTLADFYERSCKNVERAFLENLEHKYNFEYYKLESDLVNDIFIYKMNIIND